jgi:hypothetical protein
MTHRDPKLRPTAEDAVSTFRVLVSKQPSYVLRWRLRDKSAPATRRLYNDVASSAHECLHLVKQLIGSYFHLCIKLITGNNLLDSPVLFTAFIFSASASVFSVLYGQDHFFVRIRSIFSRRPFERR